MQELRLTNAHRTNADVRHFVGMIDGIAFLPLDIVSDGIFHLKDNLPVDLDDETENALNLLSTTSIKRTSLVLYVVVEMVMPLQLGEFHLYFLQKNGMYLIPRYVEKTELTIFVKVGTELSNNLWVTIIPLYGQRLD